MANLITVQQLAVDEKMLIEDIVPNSQFGQLDALVGRRLADLGFAQGMTMTLISKGLFNRGPYAVRLGSNMQFSLRRSEALKIVGHRHQRKGQAA